MNERLQELYLEAAEHMKKVQDQGLPAPYATRALAGKLAELIVKECADLCDRFQARGVGMQPAECASAIRNMFGIDQ